MEYPFVYVPCGVQYIIYYVLHNRVGVRWGTSGLVEYHASENVKPLHGVTIFLW